MKKVSLLFGVFLFWGHVVAQTITSSTSGPWNVGATWVGGIVPDASNSTAIAINHNVSIPSGYSVSIDQTTISATGLLQIDVGGTVTLANGAGNDLIIAGSNLSLDVSGTLIVSNAAVITGSTSTTTVFQSGGVYEHRYTTTQGIIPLATWDPTPGAASTLRITGYTTFTTPTAAGNWSQAFGDVEWNCTLQTTSINMAGLLTTIQNSLNVLSTGTTATTGILRFTTTGTTTISVGEDMNVNGNTRLVFCTTGVSTVNVGGDYIQNITNTATRYVRMAESAGGVGTLNITGNFNLQAGILTETGTGTAQGNINFVGSAGASHTFTEAGTPTTSLINNLSYSVADGNDLTIVGESQMAAGNTSFFSLGVNSILRVQSSDPLGAIQTGTGQSATSGNLRVTTVNRIFSAGSEIVYEGTSPQFMGVGSPAVAGITTIINNAFGVTRVAATSLTLLGNLILQTGNLTVSNTNLVVSGTTDLQTSDILFTTAASARTLTLTGNVNLGGNIIVTSGAANATLTLGGDLGGSNGISFTGANSNLTVNGSSLTIMDFPLPAATTLEGIIVTRPGGTLAFDQDVTAVTATVNSGSMDMNANLIVTGALNLATGTTLFFENQSVELRNRYNNLLTGGLLSSNASSTLNVTTFAGALGTIAFSPSGNTLGTFILNRTTAGTLVTLNSALTVTNAFTLSDGDFANTSGLNMGSGAIFTRDSKAAITGAIPTGGPYNLVYNSTNLTTGIESQGSLTNVTSNLSAISAVTVNNAITCSGILTINSGSFTAGVNAISAGSVVNSGTLNAPSTTFSIGGSFTNNGTFNKNNGTVLFSGTSSVLGTTNPTFQNLTISSGTFTAPATLNLNGALTNNGTFIAGTGTVAFLGTAGVTQLVSGSSTTNFNNITVTNTTANPDVQIQSNQNLIGVLTLAANAVLDADGSGGTSVFTLKSTGDNPTSDASIATLPAGAQVTGNVTIERYMAIEGPNNTRIYRYISSPVQGATVADMQNEISVTGSFTGTTVCPTCGVNQSMFLYNETVTTDTNLDTFINLGDGYEDFPANANSETFASGRGYAMFVRGNLLSGSARWNLTGSINQGNVTPVSFPATFASSGVPANDGWNLMGNPYPSTIDWNAASGWTKTNVGGSIQVRDNGMGVFAVWDGSISLNGGSRYISIGQGFWIQATGAPTLTADENVKVAGQQTIFLREASLTDLLRIALVKGALRDETVIHFRADALKGYDAETDTRKLQNSIFNLSTVLSTGEVLAINSLPFQCNEPNMLNITNAAAGTYRLEFSEIETFNGEVLITLTDNFLNTVSDVTSTAQYNFDITSNPLSFGSNRFTISFAEKPLSDVLQVSTLQVCEGENATVSILNSRSDASYYVIKDGISVSDTLNGNATTLALFVGKENLVAGSNNIIIHTTSARCRATKAYESMVVVNAKPSIEAVAGNICKEGSVTLKATSLSEGASFKWFADESSETVLATTAEYVTPVINKSSNYFVAALSTSDCLSARIPVSATVIQFADVVITENVDGALISSYADGNKWYFNGIEITGNSSNTLIPEKSGTYKVEVSTAGCPSSFEYEFVITATENQSLLKGISVYPNPVTDIAYIEVLENKIDIRKAVVLNSIGSAVSEITWLKADKQKKGTFDMNNLPSGVYILRLFTSNQIVNFKIYKK